MRNTSWMYRRPDIIETHHLSQNVQAVQRAHGERVEIIGKPGWDEKMATLDALDGLEQLEAQDLSNDLCLDPVQIGKLSDIPSAELRRVQEQRVLQAIHVLMPWRKGPYRLFDQLIDTEWQSGWKWDRVRQTLARWIVSPNKNDSLLDELRILDIGCGNGYYMLRAAADNPELVLGLDPNPHFYLQFELIQKYLRAPNLQTNLLGVEHLPWFESSFDLALCLGILYHRPDPLQTLRDLRQTLRPGGWVVIESQVIDGHAVSKGQPEFQQATDPFVDVLAPRAEVPVAEASEDELQELAGMYPWALFPAERYAKSRTVFFLPTPSCLVNWVRRAGFSDVRLTSMVRTTFAEQQATQHMVFESLPDFMNPEDSRQTVEGYPGPWRAIVIGRRD